jgi:hypothetical protein
MNCNGLAKGRNNKTNELIHMAALALHVIKAADKTKRKLFFIEILHEQKPSAYIP